MLDFLGKFNKKDYDELKQFIDSEEANLNEILSFIDYRIQSLTTLLNKLSQAEQTLGIKTTLTKDESNLSPQTPNSTQNEVDNDFEVASSIRSLKYPFESIIKFKGENLEFRIKKVLDEITSLKNFKYYIEEWLKTKQKDIVDSKVQRFLSSDNYPEVKV